MTLLDSAAKTRGMITWSLAAGAVLRLRNIVDQSARFSVRKLLLAFTVSGLFAMVGGSPLFGQGVLALDFSTDPADQGIVFFGAAEWREEGGVDNTGYLKVTDAVDSQSGAILFPDLSTPPGTALESFQITADLRVGAGTNDPADGFSFNLVRPDDPLLVDGTGYAASPANEANLPEEGSTTGLAIGFDEWQSGPADPTATPVDCGNVVAFDCIGISVRIDNELVAQVPFPTKNGALEDQASLQTGPRGSGTPEENRDGLGWAQLVIQVTPSLTNPETENNLFISYKDREVFNDSIKYQTTAGQLFFGGRTGGANSNHHIDNIGIIFDFRTNDADFNHDGVVDLADFTILSDNMFTEGLQLSQSDGDIDLNFRVDLEDFVAFREVFKSANAGGAAASVPEPASCLLVVSGLVGLIAMRRRTRMRKSTLGRDLTIPQPVRNVGSRGTDRRLDRESSESEVSRLPLPDKPSGPRSMTRVCSHLLVVAVLGALLVPNSVFAQDEYDVWSVPEGNWTNDDNWTFGGDPSGAPSIENETGAQIDRGILIIDSAVDTAGILLNGGTVDIREGGSLLSAKSDLNSGLTSLGGTLRIADGASFTGPDVSSRGSIEILGPTAGFEAKGDLRLTGTLHLNITGDGTPNLKVGGAAAIGGTIVPSFEGVTPAFGDSFEFLSGATSVDIKRGKVAVADSVILDRGLNMRLESTDGNASLTVGNLPILQVDRTSGAATIINVVGDTVAITGYGIRSELGLLNADAFSGIGADGWTRANSGATALGELNLIGESSLAVNGSFDIGSVYNGGATHPRDEDVTFEFSTPDGDVLAGLVEYTGPANDIVLNANPETGEVSIYHLSSHVDPVDITGYHIISANGSLKPDAWTSLSDGGDAAWTEANPRANHISELNLSASMKLENGTVLSLGNIFDTAGTRDLVLEYTTADMLFNATVLYGEVPGGGGPGPGLPGDIDGDGTVGFSDFLILSANFGTPADPVGCCGDIDGDGTVAFPDFLTLSANFGQSAGAAAATVPEPNSAALFGIGGVVLLGLRRRRRSPGASMSAGLRQCRGHQPMSGQPRRWQRMLLAMVVMAIPMGATSARADLVDDLVAYWPLDSSSSFQDAHGVHHGEERGAEPIAFEAAMFGEGIRLNGEDQYVEITGGAEDALDFVGGDVSVSAWFTVDAFDTSWQALIAKGEQSGWRVHRRSGEPTMTYAGGAAEPATGGPVVTDGEFHHIVAISENGVSTRYWMDGELASTGPAPNIQLPSTNNRVRIGDNPSTNNREWEGFIDDVGIWSRVLTAGEIAAIWSDGVGNSIGALITPFDPGDFNGDGTVDTADFAIMVSNFGEPGKFGEGDFDFNGRINMSDYLAFRTVFNAPAGAAASVPEPSGLVLVTVAGLLFMVRRRIAAK